MKNISLNSSLEGSKETGLFISIFVFFISFQISLYKFNISIFSHIFHSFSKNCIIHHLKKIAFKAIFCFLRLDQYSYQYMVLANHCD